jgi:hypothetical protein
MNDDIQATTRLYHVLVSSLIKDGATTLDVTTLSVTTLSVTTLDVTTLDATTFNIVD